MKPTPPRLHDILPHGIARAVSRIGGRMNAWVLLDASATGLAAGVVVCAPVASALWLFHRSVRGAVVAGACVALVAAAREARARWVGPFAAASALDAVLDAKDRFLSALHFAIAREASPLHALQIDEASAFLGRFDHVPSPSRPRLRSPRAALVALAVMALCLVSPWLRRTVAHWRFVHSAAAATHDLDSPQSIAARAAALREALRDSPGRRIDAEINALDRALSEQVARVEAERTRAIERAADAIDLAHKDDLEAARAANPTGVQAGTQPVASPERRAAEQALALSQREREQAEANRAALAEQLRRAETALAAAQQHGDAAAERRTQAERDALQAQLAQATAQRDQAAAHEQAAHEAMARAQTHEAQARAGDRGPEPTQATPSRPALTLDQAVSHLDQALQAVQRTDGAASVPSERMGAALDEATRELRAQLPDTSRALADASRARSANDGQRVDEAIARARASLSREAHAEPDAVRRAREAMERLHDQAADAATSAQRSGDPSESAAARERGELSRDGDRAGTSREQEALRAAQERSHGEGEQAESGDRNEDPSQGDPQQGNPTQVDRQGAASRTPGEPGQTGQNGEAGQRGQQGGASQQGASGQRGQAGQMGQAGHSGQPQDAWARAGMDGANAMAGQMGQGQPGGPGAQMAGAAGDAAQRGGATGGDIGRDQGNSSGMGMSQGNRTMQSAHTGSQTASQFNRGNGQTESDGQNRMTGQGPGQAHGATGSSGGGSPGGSNTAPTVGGRAWGGANGDRLTLGAPTATGPFGHDVDPGGTPGHLAQMAPGAHGVMMPGVAPQGAPTGPTSEAPVAPGSLLPNAVGNGALAGALDEDPEQTMTTQRVPPSLRAYVRRYFQGIQNGPAVAHPRSP